MHRRRPPHRLLFVSEGQRAIVSFFLIGCACIHANIQQGHHTHCSPLLLFCYFDIYRIAFKKKRPSTHENKGVEVHFLFPPSGAFAIGHFFDWIQLSFWRSNHSFCSMVNFSYFSSEVCCSAFVQHVLLHLFPDPPFTKLNSDWQIFCVV